MSLEQKLKRSIALMGHSVSDKVRKQCGEIWRGKHPPTEFKEKMDCEIKGYRAIHRRIIKKYGQPKYCEHCKRTDKSKYDWANLNHQYDLDIKNWSRLCSYCHTQYDMKFNNKYAKRDRRVKQKRGDI